jgi:glycosyltransferase involved in cell wall biosynthesis
MRFDYEILDGFSIDNKKLPASYHLNPGIVSKIRKRKHDVVIIGGCSDFTTQVSYLFGKVLGIPVILWSEQTNSVQTLINSFNYPIKKHIISNSNAVIVPGVEAKEFHKSMGATESDIYFAPNIIDNNKYIEEPSKFRSHTENLKSVYDFNGKTVFLFLGQLIWRKGIIELLSSYKRVKDNRDDIALLTVGDGPLRDKVEKRIQEENIQDVHLTGWVSEKQKLIFYGMADVFVLPTREDLAPLVLNEALAASLPIITTSAAGNAQDVIPKKENGWIVPPNNADELANKLSTAASQQSNLEEMGNESKEVLCERFTIQESIDGFVSAIKSVSSD